MSLTFCFSSSWSASFWNGETDLGKMNENELLKTSDMIFGSPQHAQVSNLSIYLHMAWSENRPQNLMRLISVDHLWFLPCDSCVISSSSPSSSPNISRYEPRYPDLQIADTSFMISLISSTLMPRKNSPLLIRSRVDWQMPSVCCCLSRVPYDEMNSISLKRCKKDVRVFVCVWLCMVMLLSLMLVNVASPFSSHFLGMKPPLDRKLYRAFQPANPSCSWPLFKRVAWPHQALPKVSWCYHSKGTLHHW